MPQVGGPTWTPSGIRALSFFRRGKGVRGRRRKGGVAPPSLNQFGLPPCGGGGGLVPCGQGSLPPMAHIFPPGVPVTPPVLWYVPDTLRTLPMSEYHLPLYQSLPIDHFESPRHVCDLIRDSEQPSVTKTHNSCNTYRHRTLSVRTLRVQELCRHDRDTSLVNNQ